MKRGDMFRVFKQKKSLPGLSVGRNGFLELNSTQLESKLIVDIFNSTQLKSIVEIFESTQLK